MWGKDKKIHRKGRVKKSGKKIYAEKQEKKEVRGKLTEKKR